MTQAVEHTRCQRSTSRRRTDSRPSCFLGSNKLLRGPEFFELAQTRQCGYNLLHSLNSYARLSVLPNFRHPAAQRCITTDKPQAIASTTRSPKRFCNRWGPPCLSLSKYSKGASPQGHVQPSAIIVGKVCSTCPLGFGLLGPLELSPIAEWTALGVHRVFGSRLVQSLG